MADKGSSGLHWFSPTFMRPWLALAAVAAFSFGALEWSVRAQAPMSEMLTYESSLRSMTGGRGGYSMEFSHYEEVPAHLAEKVVAAAKAEKEKAH